MLINEEARTQTTPEIENKFFYKIPKTCRVSLYQATNPWRFFKFFATPYDIKKHTRTCTVYWQKLTDNEEDECADSSTARVFFAAKCAHTTKHHQQVKNN